MRTNGLETDTASIATVRDNIKAVFDRMSRYVGRLQQDAKPVEVHRFRTYSRRVEALMGELAPASGNKRKLLKMLSKLRKKAGKVRDLDVQIAFLKELKIPDRQNHRAQLLELLVEDKARRCKKLTKHFGDGRLKQLRKRLRRAQSELALEGIDPLKLAFSQLPRPGQVPPSEKLLHACRIAAKRARYLAELLSDSSEAAQFVQELKRAQDEIGRWHDVLKLTQRAEKLFGGVRESALVAALENITHARFRRASNALQAALRTISQLQPASSSQALRPSEPQPALAAQTAAA
jgi:CHAD domain-containing protein